MGNRKLKEDPGKMDHAGKEKSETSKDIKTIKHAQGKKITRG